MFPILVEPSGLQHTQEPVITDTTCTPEVGLLCQRGGQDPSIQAHLERAGADKKKGGQKRLCEQKFNKVSSLWSGTRNPRALDWGPLEVGSWGCFADCCVERAAIWYGF